MREGYLGALNRSDFEDGCLLTTDFTSGGGYRAMKAALATETPFDGLFTTDEMAFGAIRAMKEKGLRIPEDVKVMGCDGMELGKELTPALSTVLLNRQALSERAVSRLVDLMNSSDPTVERVLLAPKLEMRGTCIP
jgi:LacI family transcriptional regulator